MLAVGILYLLFEKSILADTETTTEDLASPGLDSSSRIIIGTQVRPPSPLIMSCLQRNRSDLLPWP